jgi:hypothetical protein
MKKILLLSAAVLGLAYFPLQAEDVKEHEIFKIESEEVLAKKRLTSLENAGAIETFYADYKSKSTGKPSAYLAYEFTKKDISLLEDFMNEVSTNKYIFNEDKYSLEIHYIVGIGMSYQVKEI